MRSPWLCGRRLLVVTWCMWGLSGQMSVLGRVGRRDGTWCSKCGAGGGWLGGANCGSRLWFWALFLAVGSQEHPRTSDLWAYFTSVGTLICLLLITPAYHEIYLLFKLSLYGLMRWRACAQAAAQCTGSPGRPGEVTTPVLPGCPELWCQTKWSPHGFTGGSRGPPTGHRDHNKMLPQTFSWCDLSNVCDISVIYFGYFSYLLCMNLARGENTTFSRGLLVSLYDAT